MADEEARWLKLPKAARLCGVHPVTLRRAAQAGEVRGSQRGKGGHWSFLREDLDAWMRPGASSEERIGA